MEKFPKLFVKASIIYLAIGVIFGIVMSFGRGGFSYRFVHAHLNLFGFVAMMIFGLAYHVLPRFNVKKIRYPGLISVHFFFANIGLIGMVIFNLMGLHIVMQVFTVVSGISVFIFVFNIFPVLASNSTTVENPAESKILEERESTEIDINSEMKLGDLLNKWPDIISLLISSGLKDLENPAVRASFAKMVTLDQACKINKIELNPLIAKIKAYINNNGEKLTIRRGERCTGSVLIGDLINVYPETKMIIEKHYGTGCFSCPGHTQESIKESSGMHGIALEKILDDLNSEIDKHK